MSEHAPMAKVFALPLRLGRGTENEAPIFDRHGELRAECVYSDCDERALAVIRSVNSYDDMLAVLQAFFDAGKDVVKAGGGAPTRWDFRELQDAWQAARGLLAKATS